MQKTPETKKRALEPTLPINRAIREQLKRRKRHDGDTPRRELVFGQLTPVCAALEDHILASRDVLEEHAHSLTVRKILKQTKKLLNSRNIHTSPKTRVMAAFKLLSTVYEDVVQNIPCMSEYRFASFDNLSIVERERVKSNWDPWKELEEDLVAINVILAETADVEGISDAPEVVRENPSIVFTLYKSIYSTEYDMELFNTVPKKDMEASLWWMLLTCPTLCHLLLSRNEILFLHAVSICTTQSDAQAVLSMNIETHHLLHRCAHTIKSREVFEAFVRKYEDRFTGIIDTSDFLLRVVEGGKIEIAAFLLSRFVYNNTTLDQVLVTSVLRDSPELVSLLLSHGASPNQTVEYRDTRSYSAVNSRSSSNTTLHQAVVRVGNQVYNRTYDLSGLTPFTGRKTILSVAFERKTPLIARALLSNGAKVGNEEVISSVSSGHVYCVLIVLDSLHHRRRLYRAFVDSYTKPEPTPVRDDRHFARDDAQVSLSVDDSPMEIDVNGGIGWQKPEGRLVRGSPRVVSANQRSEIETAPAVNRQLFERFLSPEFADWAYENALDSVYSKLLFVTPLTSIVEAAVASRNVDMIAFVYSGAAYSNKMKNTHTFSGISDHVIADSLEAGLLRAAEDANTQAYDVIRHFALTGSKGTNLRYRAVQKVLTKAIEANASGFISRLASDFPDHFALSAREMIRVLFQQEVGERNEKTVLAFCEQLRSLPDLYKVAVEAVTCNYKEVLIYIQHHRVVLDTRDFREAAVAAADTSTIEYLIKAGIRFQHGDVSAALDNGQIRTAGELTEVLMMTGGMTEEQLFQMIEEAAENRESSYLFELFRRHRESLFLSDDACLTLFTTAISYGYNEVIKGMGENHESCHAGLEMLETAISYKSPVGIEALMDGGVYRIDGFDKLVEHNRDSPLFTGILEAYR